MHLLEQGQEKGQSSESHRRFSSKPVGAAEEQQGSAFPRALPGDPPQLSTQTLSFLTIQGSMLSAGWPSSLENLSFTRFKPGASHRLVCVYTRAGQPGNHSRAESFKLCFVPQEARERQILLLAGEAGKTGISKLHSSNSPFPQKCCSSFNFFSGLQPKPSFHNSFFPHPLV